MVMDEFELADNENDERRLEDMPDKDETVWADEPEEEDEE